MRLVLANKHYERFGWELVSQREEEDHLRDETSTFTSICKVEAAPAGSFSQGNCWYFKRIDPTKNKYIIELY